MGRRIMGSAAHLFPSDEQASFFAVERFLGLLVSWETFRT
jgi:hypothetical protein